MEFTDEERLAVACAMVHVINADNKVTREEVDYAAARIELTREELEEAKQIPVLKMLYTLMMMPEQKRKLIGDLLKGLANSDKNVANIEVKVIYPLLFVMDQHRG